MLIAIPLLTRAQLSAAGKGNVEGGNEVSLLLLKILDSFCPQQILKKKFSE